MTDTIIEFDFDNVEVNFSNISFDVMVRSNVNGLDFGKGEIFIQYPQSVFGTEVVGNEKMQISKGDLINSTRYSVSLIDDEDDIFKVLISGGCISSSATLSGLAISTEFQSLIRVSIEIENFNAIGSISMDEVKMKGKIHYKHPSTNACTLFDEVIVANPIETNLICSITNFASTVINAGTGDTLTIVGTGFDTIVGQVEFPNADNGGSNYISTSTSDIISWKKDTIRTLVPSNPGPAGTGIFRVRTASGMLCPSPTNLEVCYAVRTQRNSSTGVAERWHLGSSTGTNNYLFRTDSILGNNSKAVATIEKALCDWNKASKINWELGTILNTTSPRDDSLHHIFMAPSSILPFGAIATTIVTRKGCQIIGGGLIPYSGDIDIAIRQDLTTLPMPVTGGWLFDHTAIPSSNQYDFYTVILHELGHAHNLLHSMPLPKAMYWELNPGDTLRTLNAKDVMGANDVLTTSFTQLNQSFLCSPIDTATLCGTTPVFEIEELGKVKVYPNPFDLTITIELDLVSKETFDIVINDIIGRRIFHKQIKDAHPGHQILNIELPPDMSKGTYFLSLKHKNITQSFKLSKL